MRFRLHPPQPTSSTWVDLIVDVSLSVCQHETKWTLHWHWRDETTLIPTPYPVACLSSGMCLCLVQILAVYFINLIKAKRFYGPGFKIFLRIRLPVTLCVKADPRWISCPVVTCGPMCLINACDLNLLDCGLVVTGEGDCMNRRGIES